MLGFCRKAREKAERKEAHKKAAQGDAQQAKQPSAPAEEAPGGSEEEYIPVLGAKAGQHGGKAEMGILPHHRDSYKQGSERGGATCARLFCSPAHPQGYGSARDRCFSGEETLPYLGRDKQHVSPNDPESPAAKAGMGCQV
eukprot:jgi/Mesvir1/3900/Mv19846-RA.1